jgi:hypothetical protein
MLAPWEMRRRNAIRQCEEHSDEAIQRKRKLDCRASLAMTGVKSRQSEFDLEADHCPVGRNATDIAFLGMELEPNPVAQPELRIGDGRRQFGLRANPVGALRVPTSANYDFIGGCPARIARIGG